MSEEELFNIVKASKEPVRSVQELSKKLVGTRKGLFFYTENFRLDFENMCSKLSVYEEKIDDLENRLDDVIAEANLRLDEVIRLSKQNARRRHIIRDTKKIVKDFLETKEYIQVDGKAIADNYYKILKSLEGVEHE